MEKARKAELRRKGKGKGKGKGRGDKDAVKDDDEGTNDSADEGDASEEQVDDGEDELKADNGGMGDHVEGWDDEVEKNKKDAPGRHLDVMHHEGGATIRHPPVGEVVPEPAAPHDVSAVMTSDGYSLDDAFGDSGGVCILVPTSKVLGRVGKFGHCLEGHLPSA